MGSWDWLLQSREEEPSLIALWCYSRWVHCPSPPSHARAPLVLQRHAVAIPCIAPSSALFLFLEWLARSCRLGLFPSSVSPAEFSSFSAVPSSFQPVRMHCCCLGEIFDADKRDFLPPALLQPCLIPCFLSLLSDVGLFDGSLILFPLFLRRGGRVERQTAWEMTLRLYNRLGGGSEKRVSHYRLHFFRRKWQGKVVTKENHFHRANASTPSMVGCWRGPLAFQCEGAGLLLWVRVRRYRLRGRCPPFSVWLNLVFASPPPLRSSAKQVSVPLGSSQYVSRLGF